MRVINTETFVTKAKMIHGDRYNYSCSVYVKSKEPIEIKCNQHGSFWQRPNNHLARSSGCPSCRSDQMHELFRHTTESFVTSSRTAHGDKYDYSLVNYKNEKTKVTIICPDHGEFKQRPKQHTRGEGCPRCNESKGERAIADELDSLGIRYEREKKFEDLGRLRFDFYLPDHNVLIEFDGRQHREPVVAFGGTKGFKRTQKHDNIKNQYAKKHGIPLYRFS